MSEPLLAAMIAAARAAAVEINRVYAEAFTPAWKSDGSPVTEADAAAEAAIIALLAPTGISILAEESVAAGRVPACAARMFVVDPLDGTREFLKRNDEFAVNIALCEDGRPTLGVVLSPVTGQVWWGGPDGAFTSSADGAAAPIRVSDAPPLRVVGSRSHGHKAMRSLCHNLGVVEDISVGSSLKFCLLAEGRAALYPRLTPTSEWDTAAGQAIVEAAGGVVLDLDGRPLTCGHADRGFLNGHFAAAASRGLAERSIAVMRSL